MNPLLQLLDEIIELEDEARSASGRLEHWEILQKIDWKKDRVIGHLNILVKDMRQAFPQPTRTTDDCPACLKMWENHHKLCPIRRADEFLARSE